jgi:hypothetical protein
LRVEVIVVPLNVVVCPDGLTKDTPAGDWVNTTGNQYMLSTYQKGLWNALRQLFPGMPIKGCVFHWCQAIFRKIQKSGLAVSYSSKGSAYTFPLKLMALPFLPREHIPQVERQVPNDSLRVEVIVVPLNVVVCPDGLTKDTPAGDWVNTTGNQYNARPYILLVGSVRTALSAPYQGGVRLCMDQLQLPVLPN